MFFFGTTLKDKLHCISTVVTYLITSNFNLRYKEVKLLAN